APGLFKPIFAAVQGMTLTKGTLPAAGTIRICNVFGCPASVAVKLTQTDMGNAIGPGVGGTIVATGMSGTMTPVPATMVFVQGHPWTVNTTTVSYRKGPATIETIMSMGFAKGPLGNAGTTLNATSMGMRGTLQLVSGIQTTCAACPGGSTPSGQIT